ncbi:MAG: winged helix-turn-helix transcriptional regulator [Candidatus Eremiobacteraeota bacterium]|nr:winged helix-turn-helix transcriptional regulator [Candidatus Eremiobacteraeota bacterium]
MPGTARLDASLGAVFGALANEQRRAIVVRLAQSSVSTPEVASQFEFTKQALSRHVAILEDAGLVRRTMRGRTYDLVLVPEPLDHISRWLVEIRRGWCASLDRLDQVLRSKDHD